MPLDLKSEVKEFLRGDGADSLFCKPPNLTLLVTGGFFINCSFSSEKDWINLLKSCGNLFANSVKPKQIFSSSIERINHNFL